MMSDYCVLISSCDKYSDLWDAHFLLLYNHWTGRLPQTYLVTDKPTTRSYPGVKILDFDGDMPIRLLKACEVIPEQFILLTLDDYFLISDTSESAIKNLVANQKEMEIDYLRIYDRRRPKKGGKKTRLEQYPIDLSQKYAVSLYPAIWEKGFLMKCIDGDSSPWMFEPSLTEKAKERNAKCFANTSGVFEILDVVRKGKVLHKAKRYLKKNRISIGERPTLEWKYEIKQAVADFIWWYMPRWVYKVARRTAELFGMKFFSKE